MALNHLLLLVVGIALSLSFFSLSEAGEAGVCYGLDGNDLINPSKTVALLKNNGITMVRLYGANPDAMNALANTNIKVSVLLRNEDINDAAMKSLYAAQWVQNNVQAFPHTLIDSIAVGNEVFREAPNFIPNLIPAMKNIHEALVKVGLDGTVKVSTPIAFDAIKSGSFPPSTGVFRDDIAQSVMSPMIDFLEQTGSFLMFNIYPYFAYRDSSSGIPLDYTLGLPNNGVLDAPTNLRYYSLFDAMLDTVYYAIENLANSGLDSQKMLTSGRGHYRVKVRVTETGFPHGSTGPLKNHARVSERKDSENVATKENAQKYNSILVSKALSASGTPHYPNVGISVYVFSLFDENLKPGPAIEQNFGLFYPSGNPVYKIPDFANASPSQSWCVANAAVGADRLQVALDFACANGADCSDIQPGARCFNPDTKVAHASYAFNDYYQRNGRSDKSCDFNGCGSVVYQQPKIGNCVLPPKG